MTTTSITPHPDQVSDYHRLKAIHRGSMQAIEDKAIAEYIKVYEDCGREAAEETFFKHFNKGTNGKTSVTLEVN